MANTPMMKNAKDQWVPAIPLPFCGLRKRCGHQSQTSPVCNRKFWTMEGYKGHYAYVHIVEGR